MNGKKWNMKHPTLEIPYSINVFGFKRILVLLVGGVMDFYVLLTTKYNKQIGIMEEMKKCPYCGKLIKSEAKKM